MGRDKKTIEKGRNGTTAHLDMNAEHRVSVDPLRNTLDAAHKYVVLGLVFPNDISDALNTEHAEVEAQEPDLVDSGGPAKSRAVNIFRVPETSWSCAA